MFLLYTEITGIPYIVVICFFLLEEFTAGNNIMLLNMPSAYSNLLIDMFISTWQWPCTCGQSGGARALHCAAFEGHYRVVQVLLDLGASIEAQTALGRGLGILPLNLLQSIFLASFLGCPRW